MAEQILINKIPYYLPLTRVRIYGKRTTRKDVLLQVSGVSEVKVDLVTTADPNHPRYIQNADSLLADRQLTVEWTETGMLSNTDATSTGKLGEIIKNVFGAVFRFALFFGGGMGIRSMEVAGLGDKELENAYATAFADLAAARRAAKKAVSELLKAIADQSAALGSELDPEKVNVGQKRLHQLTETLEQVKKQAESLENHFNAWKGSAQEEVTPRDCTVALEVLPKEDDIRPLQDKTEAEIRAALRSLADLFWDLRVIVADAKIKVGPYRHIGKANDADPPLEKPDNSQGVEFRIPRPTVLSLFEIRENNTGKFTAVLKERREISVSDDTCPTALMRTKGSALSKKSVDIDFFATGIPKKVSTDSGADFAALAEALAKLPAEALQSVKDANVFIDERQKLALQSVEQRIEELKKEREEALARIAKNETLATEQQMVEVKRLEQEIALLKKQIELKQLAGTSDSDVQLKLLEIQEDLVHARTNLEKAEIERLKVQAELKKATEPKPKE